MNVTPLTKALKAGAAVLMALSLTTAPLAQTADGTNAPLTSQAKEDVLKKVTDYLTHNAYVPTIDFDQWPSFVQNEKPKLDAANTEEDYGRALDEALNKFGASHIFLATPRMAEQRRDASMVGIGISQQQTPDGIMVIRTVPGAPAEEAGLVPGDLIIKVDGQKLDPNKDEAAGIRGKEGTKVILTVKHQDGKIKDYEVTRRKFSTVRPEELTEVDKDTAKLTIYTFDWTYSRSNVEILMHKADAYKNLILDLRGNGGGAVSNLQHLLGMLIPNDEAMGTFVNKEMVNAYIRDTGGKPSEVIKIAEWSRHQDPEEWGFQQIHPTRSDLPVYRGNIAVLINGGSGSASEIAAAALHDLVGATVIGQKSAGAVLVSVIQNATNGFTLQFPIMDYVTVKGVRLEGTGVTPAISVPIAKTAILPGQPDEAVVKAQELFAHNHEDKGIGA